MVSFTVFSDYIDYCKTTLSDVKSTKNKLESEVRKIEPILNEKIQDLARINNEIEKKIYSQCSIPMKTFCVHPSINNYYDLCIIAINEQNLKLIDKILDSKQDLLKLAANDGCLAPKDLFNNIRIYKLLRNKLLYIYQINSVLSNNFSSSDTELLSSNQSYYDRKAEILDFIAQVEKTNQEIINNARIALQERVDDEIVEQAIQTLEIFDLELLHELLEKSETANFIERLSAIEDYFQMIKYIQTEYYKINLPIAAAIKQHKIITVPTNDWYLTIIKPMSTAENTGEIFNTLGQVHIILQSLCIIDLSYDDFVNHIALSTVEQMLSQITISIKETASCVKRTKNYNLFEQSANFSFDRNNDQVDFANQGENVFLVDKNEYLKAIFASTSICEILTFDKLDFEKLFSDTENTPIQLTSYYNTISTKIIKIIEIISFSNLEVDQLVLDTALKIIDLYNSCYNQESITYQWKIVCDYLYLIAKLDDFAIPLASKISVYFLNNVVDIFYPLYDFQGCINELFFDYEQSKLDQMLKSSITLLEGFKVTVSETFSLYVGKYIFSYLITNLLSCLFVSYMCLSHALALIFNSEMLLFGTEEQQNNPIAHKLISKLEVYIENWLNQDSTFNLGSISASTMQKAIHYVNKVIHNESYINKIITTNLHFQSTINLIEVLINDLVSEFSFLDPETTNIILDTQEYFKTFDTRLLSNIVKFLPNVNTNLLPLSVLQLFPNDI